MEDVVEVAYGEGWDLATRTLWRPLTAEAAAVRDAAGLPYVAAYRRAGREAPLEVRLTSWRDHFTGVWVYDEQGRRTCRLDLRLLDGDRLLHHEAERWSYPAAGAPEFDPGCERRKMTLYPDGRGSDERERPGRGLFVSSADVPEEQRRLDRPGFGSWPLFSAQEHGIADGVPFAVAEPEPEPEPEGNGEGEPKGLWSAPRPAEPVCLDELFRPGTRLAAGYHPDVTVLPPVAQGTLRVPSGELAVDAPDNYGEGGPRIVIPVPPGEYALEEAQTRARGESYVSTPAARLRLSDAPVASWEMALGEDDDVRLLGDGEAYGFGTDGASGCFADAAAWDALKQRFARAHMEGDEEAGEGIADSLYFLRTADPEAAGGAGADLAAFYTCGDGVWPVWIGRSAAGDVVCVTVVGDFDYMAPKVIAQPTA
ncbi:DUF4241 domain-containing protein [Streptomyces sp. NPDC051909]|uniref:DUF4241 domain-containing protein n=1 Tax=Streptomyces sp. NPDC051909 TaxID=3154944 RepID=UPI00341277A6